MIFKNTHCINQKTKYLEIKNKKFSFIYYNLFTDYQVLKHNLKNNML